MNPHRVRRPPHPQPPPRRRPPLRADRAPVLPRPVDPRPHHPRRQVTVSRAAELKPPGFRMGGHAVRACWWPVGHLPQLASHAVHRTTWVRRTDGTPTPHNVAMPANTTSAVTPDSAPAQPKPRRTAAEKQRRAVEMRTTGASFQDIADALGYRDRSTARRSYLAGLSHLPELEDRDTMLRVESARLDALQAAVWKLAMTGDSESVRTVLRVMQRRAKLLGLDAPTKTEHKVTSELDAEIEQMLKDFDQLRPGRSG